LRYSTCLRILWRVIVTSSRHRSPETHSCPPSRAEGFWKNTPNAHFTNALHPRTRGGEMKVPWGTFRCRYVAGLGLRRTHPCISLDRACRRPEREPLSRPECAGAPVASRVAEWNAPGRAVGPAFRRSELNGLTERDGGVVKREIGRSF
jgi:hypothetical protein